MFFQVGFYNQNCNNYDRGNGFYLDGSPSLGNLLPFEFGWNPVLGANKLPGNYRIGGYFSSVNGDKYASYHNGNSGNQAKAYGGYVLLQQQLTATDGDVKRGLCVTVQAVMNDHKTSKIDNYQAVSFTWKGPIIARAQDEIGLGAARIHVNSDYSKMQKESNEYNGEHDYNSLTYLPIQHGSEWNYEVYYNLHATNWLNLRPSLQYVASPGGVSGVKDAFIGGLSANVNF